MARRIAVLNQKGGVAKTTTAVNLAACLAARGKRVLLVDVDPQGNAGHFLGLIERMQEGELYISYDFLLCPERPFAPQRDVVVSGLDVVPSNVRLAAAELPLLRDTVTGIQKLAVAVRRIEGEYDFVLADCPPTLGMLALNAIVACPEVLVPVRLAAATLPGLADLAQILEVVKDTEPAVHLMGVLGTYFAEGANGPKEALELIKQQEQFAGAVFDTVIHRAQLVEDACGKGVPVVLAAPKSRAALQYQALADEVLARGTFQRAGGRPHEGAGDVSAAPPPVSSGLASVEVSHG
jgi:chromosome partitioning protein